MYNFHNFYSFAFYRRFSNISPVLSTQYPPTNPNCLNIPSTGGIYDSEKREFLAGSSELRIRANIINKNDRPVVARAMFMLSKSLPYKLENVTEGTKVRDILSKKLVKDPDGDDIGS